MATAQRRPSLRCFPHGASSVLLDEYWDSVLFRAWCPVRLWLRAAWGPLGLTRCGGVGGCGTVAAAGATIEKLRRLTDRAWPLSECSALLQWPASRGGTRLVCLRHSVIGPSLPCAVLPIACCGWRGWIVDDGDAMGDGGRSGARAIVDNVMPTGNCPSRLRFQVPLGNGPPPGPGRQESRAFPWWNQPRLNCPGLDLRPVLLTGARPADVAPKIDRDYR